MQSNNANRIFEYSLSFYQFLFYLLVITVCCLIFLIQKFAFISSAASTFLNLWEFPFEPRWKDRMYAEGGRSSLILSQMFPYLICVVCVDLPVHRTDGIFKVSANPSILGSPVAFVHCYVVRFGPQVYLQKE